MVNLGGERLATDILRLQTNRTMTQCLLVVGGSEIAKLTHSAERNTLSKKFSRVCVWALEAWLSRPTPDPSAPSLGPEDP